jgi:hypothetical protein
MRSGGWVRRLWLWLWAALIAAGVSAALLAGAAAAHAEADSDPGPSHVASQPTNTDVGRHGILSGHRLSTSSTGQPRAANHGPLSLLHAKLTNALDTKPTDSASAVTSAPDSASRPTAIHRRLGLLRATPSHEVDGSTADGVATPSPTAQPARAVGSLIGGIVSKVGSIAFNTLQAVETVVTGPPTVPKGSTVTVHTSTIQLSNGQTVPANWYFPETDDGKPPDNMILLQHGFLAQGPMYSYTAANLAEQTHSVVVTPTLSSNPFAGDANWLGGTGMAESIGELFVGDRTALTASAVDAGYADAYGLNPATAQLPEKFALEGHSLGANLVAGAAGFIAADPGGAGDNLVGVILLDGVPIGQTLPDALTKLDTYTANGGHYIPVRQIGAPLNLFNSVSTVNDDLTAARPSHFNGVILDGGVHMDSMRGGNPLIQIAAYAIAGFPQPQNPPAVDELSVDWLNEWFLTGDTGSDDDLVPGSTIDIDTPQGTAHGVVIGASHPKVLAAALQRFFPLLLSLAA